MWGIFRKNLYPTSTLLSRTRCYCLNNQTRFINPIVVSFFRTYTSTHIIITNPLSSLSFCSYTNGDETEPDNIDYLSRKISYTRKCFAQDVDTIFGILTEHGKNKLETENKLEQLETVIEVSSDLVVEVLSRVRNDWETAFTFFKWAQNKPNFTHSLRAYHSMISILAKMSKFDTAWALINEMRRESLVTSHTLMIMIRRYCAVHEVAKAVNTFYAYRLFKFDVGMDEFHGLLSALCRYKNLKEAESFLFCNEKVFAFNTKSFNIILHGWCNVIGNPREAKRVWKEMEEKGVARDVISYSNIISCFSKHGNLYEALKLFKQMKELNIALDMKVYNTVIHALAKKRLVKDACGLLKTMKESGIAPNIVSYNSLIMPLCKSGKLDEARIVFDTMLQRGVSPSDRTFHAFFRVLRSKEEVFTLLEKMNSMGLYPKSDTYVMLIRKFSRWSQLDDVFKLWSEIMNHGGPDRNAYVALVHGLFLNGKLEEAYQYNEEMKGKNYFPEPELEKILSGKTKLQ